MKARRASHTFGAGEIVLLDYIVGRIGQGAYTPPIALARNPHFASLCRKILHMRGVIAEQRREEERAISRTRRRRNACSRVLRNIT